MYEGQVIQMLAGLFGAALTALGLGQLLRGGRAASAPTHRALDVVLGGAGVALSASWEGSRAYLAAAAATSAAVGLAGSGPDTAGRSLAPRGRAHRFLHLTLAFLMFQAWIANLEDRDKAGDDSPPTPWRLS